MLFTVLQRPLFRCTLVRKAVICTVKCTCASVDTPTPRASAAASLHSRTRSFAGTQSLDDDESFLSKTQSAHKSALQTPRRSTTEVFFFGKPLFQSNSECCCSRESNLSQKRRRCLFGGALLRGLCFRARARSGQARLMPARVA